MHASGSDEEYVQKAIAEDLKLLGFSDHAPYVYHGGYRSYYKMQLDEADGYFDSIERLREKYADEIDISIGYEAEFYPELWEETLVQWRKRPPEYLILGQHFVDFENINGQKGDRSFRFEPPADRERIARYADRVIDGMATELFSCVAHPDLISFSGDVNYYLCEMERIIAASKKYGVPLEFNLLGFSKGRGYPRADFWKLVGSHGGSAVIGCDAHEPHRVADKEELRAARALMESCGVKILETIELRRPF